MQVLDYFTVVITRNIAVLDDPALHNVSVPAEARTNSLKQTKSSTAAIEAQKELTFAQMQGPGPPSPLKADRRKRKNSNVGLSGTEISIYSIFSGGGVHD